MTNQPEPPLFAPPAAAPPLPLYVQTPGARIAKKGFTLVIRVEGEAPAFRLSSLPIATAGRRPIRSTPACRSATPC